MLTRLALALTLTALLAGCASSPKSDAPESIETPEYAPDKVIGRSDELSKRPDWVSETVSVQKDGSKIRIIGASEVPADSRVQAAFKLSDAATRGNLAGKIETNVIKIVEAHETGLGMDDQQLRALVREVSQASFKNVDIKSRYWEKIIRTQSTREKQAVMKVFSLIELSESELKKLFVEAAKKAKSAPKKSAAQFASILDQHWDEASFTE